MTADEHKWCDEHKLAPANPELDAANKKIAELTAQLATIVEQAKLYRDDALACRDREIFTQAAKKVTDSTPKDASTK